MTTSIETVPVGGRKRDPRRKVAVAARMKVDSTWSDVTILNVSDRGLMLSASADVEPRSYVEIRKGSGLAIVGRVVWRRGRRIGIRAQDKVDVDTITHATGSPYQPRTLADERRSAARRTGADAAGRADRSREQSAVMQYGVLVTAIVIAACLAVATVHDTLSTMAARVGQAL